MRAARPLALVSLALSACLTTPQREVEYDATAIPSAQRTLATGGWTVTLTRADLAFGPAYFCAAAPGSSKAMPTPPYDLTAVKDQDGDGKISAYDYVNTQMRTFGDYQGDGECPTRAPVR